MRSQSGKRRDDCSALLGEGDLFGCAGRWRSDRIQDSGRRDQGGRRDLESLAYADAVGIAEVVGLSENAPLARRSEVLLGDRGEGVAGLNDVFLHGGLTSCPPVETRGGIEGTVKVRQLTTSRIEPSMGNGGWPDGL